MHARARGIISRMTRIRGSVAAVDARGRTILIADAHGDNGKRFVVHADEKLSAFVELESAVRACGAIVLDGPVRFFQTRRR